MKLDTLRVAPAERLPSDPSNPRLGAGAFIQCLGRSEREALVPSSRGADSSPRGDTETWSRIGAFKPETWADNSVAWTRFSQGSILAGISPGQQKKLNL